MLNSTIYAFLFALFSVPGLVRADVGQVDNAELDALRASGVTIIDVRRQDEWEATGMIRGSHPITFFDARGRYDAQAWLEAVDQIVKPDQTIVLICARGVRSSKIADFLDKRLGFSDVRNVTDGINAWIREQGEVVPYSD